jgi:fumarylacetoacetate (FAA) hydrolase family protein
MEELMMTAQLTAGNLLLRMTDQEFEGAYVARVWDPEVQGPSVVRIEKNGVWDISRAAPTLSSVLEAPAPADFLRQAQGKRICSVEDVLNNSWFEGRNRSKPWLLSPFDIQVVKGAGVTFAKSMLERVIEERALGNASEAAALRDAIEDQIGDSLAALKPGSDEAENLKKHLIEIGLWSQYLEVGIGPDAEIFTKGAPLSSVGFGADVGVSEISTWNNPEPEIVLAVSSSGSIVGATLGNDVNLRDIEGRSALLLGRAKDNTASAGIGPWIRLFDQTFTERDIATSVVTLDVAGKDGFSLRAEARIEEISRSFSELVEQLMGSHHQYPDGAALFLGTPFAPVDDRDEKGKGFTHHLGDVVTISTPSIGSLCNTVNTSESCEPWSFGIGEFMKNLAQRGLQEV